MKNLISILIFLNITLYTYAQNQNISGNSFITIIQNITVYGVDASGTIDKDKKFKIPLGTKFNVNGFDDSNNVKITFWNYGSKKKLSDKEKNFTHDYSEGKEFIGPWSNDRDFIIKLKDFNSGTKFYYGPDLKFTWGVMTLPIKARMGNKKDRYFDVEENLNLGFTFGLRQQLESKKEQAFNYLAGVSISRVRTDSISLLNKYPAPQSSVASALTFNLGILYQYESFQVGFFVGYDNVMGELGRNWKFQGKPWVGFAVGVSLFSSNSTQSNGGTNKD